MSSGAKVATALIGEDDSRCRRGGGRQAPEPSSSGLHNSEF